MIREYIKMISSFSNLIDLESAKSWSGIDFKDTEPKIVKDYLLSANVGVDYMNDKIARAVSASGAYELKFASIYCHQKPRIIRTAQSIGACLGSTKACELGDLMIIFLLLDQTKKIVYSSAKLMQAKKNDVLDSFSQQCLYDSDLDFNAPANLISHSTCVTPLRFLPDYHQDRNKALAYLILQNSLPYVKMIPSSTGIQCSWSTDLQMLLELKTGLSFSPPKNSTDNSWNCIVNDLMNIGTGIVPSSIGRGSGVDYIVNAFNDYDYYPEYKKEFDYTGIPKMIVICKDKERRL